MMLVFLPRPPGCLRATAHSKLPHPLPRAKQQHHHLLSHPKLRPLLQMQRLPTTKVHLSRTRMCTTARTGHPQQAKAVPQHLTKWLGSPTPRQISRQLRKSLPLPVQRLHPLPRRMPTVLMPPLPRPLICLLMMLDVFPLRHRSQLHPVVNRQRSRTLGPATPPVTHLRFQLTLHRLWARMSRVMRVQRPQRRRRNRRTASQLKKGQPRLTKLWK